MPEYYSERISKPRARTRAELDERAWGGLVALVESSLTSNIFAERFPEACPDGRGVCATDERTLRLAMLAEHPGISWPLDPSEVPDTPEALDLVEFLHEHAAEPVQGDFHSFFGHHHLSFNRPRGQKRFREQVNRILSRNGLAYELGEDGQVERLLEPVLQEELRAGLPRSGDDRVDSLISQAEERLLDPDPIGASDALEKLWDAFERLKTLLDPNKKTGAKSLVDTATTTAASADVVEAEMIALTEIGNSFYIRHHETTKHPVPEELVDYLFMRMYVLLRLLIGGVGDGP